MNNTRFLSDEQIYKYPTFRATNHDGKRSDRYNFVSPMNVINQLQELAWGVTKVMAPNARAQNSLHYGKYMITFEPQDDSLQIPDPRREGQWLIPQVVYFGSSNGTCSNKILAGLFAMICSNGMVIRDSSLGDFVARHDDSHEQDVINAVLEITRNIERIGDVIQDWANLPLSQEIRNEYYSRAFVIRYPDREASHMDISNIGMFRRMEDSQPTLWNAFQRVQENLIRGGVQVGKRRNSEIRNIERFRDINTGLWELTNEYYQENV